MFSTKTIHTYILLAIALMTINAIGGDEYARAMKMAKNYEIQTMPKPNWATRDTPPLFTMAWMSDLHITDSKSLELVTLACNKIRDSIKPNFTLITGDNSGYFADLSDEEMQLSVDEKRQLWLKRFLDKELATTYKIIPGDNWPWAFDKVFGKRHQSFDVCGYHFLLTSTDAQGSHEGCSIIYDSTLEWIQKDLAANADKPCIYVMHETLWPPFFINVQQAINIVNNSQQTLAVFSGHLHFDMDIPHNHWRQIVAPAIGRSHRPAFKLVSFYNDVIILNSYEYQDNSNSFEQVSKWQKIDIPNKLAVKTSPFAIKEINSLPPSPKTLDNSLNEKTHILSNNLMGFIFGFGLQQLFK